MILKEIIITSEANKVYKKKIGYRSFRRNVYFYLGAKDSRFVFIKNTEEQEGKMQKLRLVIEQGEEPSCSLGVNFYEVKKEGNTLVPGKSFLEKDIWIHIGNTTKGRLVIDVSDSSLSFPREGIFICLKSRCQKREGKNGKHYFGLRGYLSSERPLILFKYENQWRRIPSFEGRLKGYMVPFIELEVVFQK